MSVLILNKENFKEQVLDSKTPVLVDFWAPWCNPCRMLAPIIEEIAEEANDFQIGKVNIDEEPLLAQEYGVSSIPTLILFSEGKAKNYSVGVKPKQEILNLLKSESDTTI